MLTSSAVKTDKGVGEQSSRARETQSTVKELRTDGQDDYWYEMSTCQCGSEKNV